MGAVGGATLSLASANLGTTETCTITLQVQSSTVGTNTSADIAVTADSGVSFTAASANLTVQANDVVFSKSFSSSTVDQGETLRMTYLVDNSASAGFASNFRFTETLPTGVVVAPGSFPTDTCGSSGAQSVTAEPGGSQIQFNAGTPLAAGQTCTVNVDVQANASGSFDLTSSNFSFSNASFQFRTLGPATAALTVLRSDLALAKQYTSSTVPSGGTLRTEYTISNNGRSSNATGVAFTDDLNALTPAGAGTVFDSVVSNTCGGSVTGTGTGTFGLSGGTVASGASCSITISATLGALTAGTYASETSAVTGTFGGATTTGNTGNASFTVTAASPPVLTMSFPDTLPGASLAATFSITNPNSTAMTGATFQVLLSDVFGETISQTFTAVSGCTGGTRQGFVSGTGERSVLFTNGSMGATGSGTETCTFGTTFPVPASLSSGTYTLTSSAPRATVGSESLTGTIASDTFTIGEVAFNLGLTKAFANTVNAGGTVDLIYTITAAAENGVTATAINFGDDIGTAITGATLNAGASTSTCGGAVTGTTAVAFSGASLAAGANCTITVPVTLAASTPPGSYSSTTQAFSATGSGASVPFANAQADLTVNQLMRVSGSMAPSDVVAGGSANFTILLDNTASTEAVTNIFFTTNLARGLSGATAGAFPASNTCGMTLGGSTSVTASGGSVAAGATCTVVVPIITPASATDNTSRFVTSVVSGQVSSLAATFESAFADLQINSAKLVTSKAFASSNVVAGSTVGVTISITNDSASPATGVSVADDLNAFVGGATTDFTGANALSLSGCGAGVATGGSSLSASSIGIAGNGTCTISFGVAIPAGTAPSTYTNTASGVSGTLGGLTVVGANATATLQVQTTVTPTISVSISPSTVNVGQAATITYQISNPAGGINQLNLQLSDTLGTAITGSTVTGVSSTCGSGASISGGSNFSLSGGSLTAGASCQAVASVTVGASGAGASYATDTVQLSNNGLALATAPGVNLTVKPVPATLAKSYAAASFAQGGSTVLTYQINNSGSAQIIGGLAFTDALPSNVVIAPTPVASSACGGSLTATAGTGSIALSGGTAAANSSCTISVPVTSAVVVPSTSTTTSTLSTAFGSSAAASASVAVTAAPVPGFTAQFPSSTLVQGDTTTLTYVINNGSSLVDATAFAFTGNLPTGMVISAMPNAATTCSSGTVTATAGGSSLGFAGGTATASTSCTVSVNVRATAAGNLTASSTAPTSSLGNSPAASAALLVSAAPAPTVALQTLVSSIEQGRVFTATVALNNVNSLVAATNAAISVTLPSGLAIASGGVSNVDCTGGTVTGVAGGSSFALTGATLAAGGTCSFTAEVLANDVGTGTLQTSILTSSLADGTAASRQINVTAPRVPRVQVELVTPTTVQGVSTRIFLRLSNPAIALDATFDPFTITLPTGVVFTEPSSASSSCTGAAVSVTEGASTLNIPSATVTPNETCLIQVRIVSPNVGTFTVPVGALSTTLGTTTAVSAVLSVTGAPAPTLFLSASPATIVQGGRTTLTLSIENNSFVPATGLAGTFVLPAGFSLIDGANITTAGNCTAPSATVNGSDLDFTVGQVDAKNFCFISVPVLGTTVGGTSLTTTDVTSNLGNSGSASRVVTVTGAGVPVFTKSFSSASIVQGAQSRLTFTINNTGALVAATGGVITDTFPAGLVVAPDPALSASCNNAASTATNLTAVAGGTSVTSGSLDVAAGDSCTYGVSVTAAAVGSLTNVSDPLTTSLGSSGTAAATLEVTAAPQPTFTKQFAAASIAQGNSVLLTLTLDNARGLVDATGAGFTDTFPAGMTVATAGGAGGAITNTCGGSATAASGGTAITLTGGTISAGGECTVSVNVASGTVGTATNVSGPMTSSLGTTASGTATASLNVVAAGAPTFAKVYAPDSIVQGGTTTIRYTIGNASSLVQAMGVTFADTFPSGVTVASTPNVSSTNCGTPVVVAAAGDGSASFSGITIDAGASCTVQLDVTAVDTGTFETDTGALSATFNGTTLSSGVARAALAVTSAAAPAFAQTFAPASIVQGGSSTVTFSIDNSASLVPATALAFANDLPGGVTITAAGIVANTCTGGTLVATQNSTNLSYTSGSVDAGATCEISVAVTSMTLGSVTNTTGDLVSDLGNSGASSADLDVSGAPVPDFAKSFAAASIAQGDVTRLTFTIENTASLVDATGAGFVDTFPAGMRIAATPSLSVTGCGGALADPIVGAGSFSVSAATIAAGATCTVAVNVTALDAGDAVNVTGDLTTSVGNSGTATATLAVNAADVPTFTASFAPSSITQGATSTLLFTIDNADTLVAVTGLGFSNALPGGLTVASVPNATTTCGQGSLTAAAGASSLSLSGGGLDLGASCTVSVDVTSQTVGQVSTTSSVLTSNLGEGVTATASLTVTAASAPELTSRFDPARIAQGGVTNLIFVVDNTRNGIGASGLGLAANLPTGLLVAPGATGVTFCGGTLVAAPGTGVISLSGGAIGSATTCEVSIPVTSITEGTLGAVSASLSSSLGAATLTAGGSTPLEVVVNPAGTVTIIQNASDDDTYTFASSEGALNFAISTSGGSGQVGPISLNAGSYVITQSRPDGVGNTALSCSDGDSVVDRGTGTVTLNLAALENLVCTYSSVNSRTEAVETINAFLQRRNNLILTHAPSQSRRLARLAQGPLGGSTRLSFHKGNIKSFVPGKFNLRGIKDGNWSVATSLIEAERAHTMFLLGNDLDPDYTTTLKNRRLDVWFEAHYSKFTGVSGAGGHFGIAYLGADYLIDQDTLAGVVLQYDTLDDTNSLTGNRVDGQGWMIGPYLTKRIGPNLIFDGRFAYGKSSNDMKTSVSTGEFDTTRFLLDLNLTGNFDWNNWIVSPNLNVSYIQDEQHAFTDSLNVLIPSQTVELGQIKFGPTFSTSFVGARSIVYQPAFTVNGIYNFANTRGVTITNNTADETDGLRARIEANLRVTNRHGAKFEIGANYDGIGKPDFESFGFKFDVNIPLQ